MYNGAENSILVINFILSSMNLQRIWEVGIGGGQINK